MLPRPRVGDHGEKVALAVQHEAGGGDLALDRLDVDPVQAVGGGEVGTGGGVMVDHHIEAARLQRLEHRGVDLRGGVLRERVEVQVVIVLGGEHQVEAGRELRRADRRTDGVDIGQGVDLGQALAIAGLEADELGGLPGGDPALGADGGGEDAGEIAAADDHVGDLLTGLHAGEGQGFGCVAGRVAGAVFSRTDVAGQNGGVVLGRGLGRRHRGQGEGGGEGEEKRTTHDGGSWMIRLSRACGNGGRNGRCGRGSTRRRR